MPWLTCLIGVGPWVFKTYEWGIGAVFVANRNYHAILLETDINFDRSVNILDVSAAARAFGSIPGQPRWSGTVDLNGDIQVNILDLARIAKDFGKTY
jgi:ABC-type transport system substrate-binding protein